MAVQKRREKNYTIRKILLKRMHQNSIPKNKQTLQTHQVNKKFELCKGIMQWSYVKAK